MTSGQTRGQSQVVRRLVGPSVVVDSDQPDQRVWAPSQGSPQAGGGQSPGPADWPAPRRALGPQTWQQRQRRKAVSDGQKARGTGPHSRHSRSATHPPHTQSSATRARRPGSHSHPHKPGPASIISSRPTTRQTNTKPPALSPVSFLQAGRGLPLPLSAPCITKLRPRHSIG